MVRLGDVDGKDSDRCLIAVTRLSFWDITPFI